MKENDRNRRLVLALLLVAIVVATVGTTLAYFITQGGTNEEQKLTIKTGNLALTFEDNDSGLNASLSLGQTVSKEFKITNTGTEDITTTMLWSRLVNTYLEESLQYRLQYKTSETGDWQNVNIAHGTIPHSETAKDYNLSKDIIIPSGETHFYKLDITFLNLANINQENDKTAILTTKFNLGEKIIESNNILAVRGTNYNGTSSYKEKLWAHQDNITSVVFENTLSPKENVAYTYDMSDYSSDSVIAYIVPNGETITNSDNSTSPAYTAYIQADGKIMANKNSSYLFNAFRNLKGIEGLEYLDTSNVTTMFGMFQSCQSLISLDVSDFDTSKVTSMAYMFMYCRNLTSLDVGHFDTRKVTAMANMFQDCRELTNLDVSHFDTRKVTSFDSMFANCIRLTSIDVSNFDTSNATSTRLMFSRCSGLISLDVSHFDTRKVTNMSQMFSGCSSLTNLNVDSFNTSMVADMANMFQNCSGLTNLNVSGFDTGNVTDMKNMFLGCSSLTNLDLSNFNTNNVRYMERMFKDCESLTSLDLSTFNTSNVISMGDTTYGGMFQNCNKLTNLNIRNFDIKNVVDKDNIFNNVSSNIKITVANETLRDWCIEVSTNPKLTTSNFIMG